MRVNVGDCVGESVAVGGVPVQDSVTVGETVCVMVTVTVGDAVAVNVLEFVMV